MATVATRKKSPFAGVLDVQRLSRPQLSWFILTAAAFVVAVVLLVWVLLWIRRPRASMDTWWVAQRGLATPIVGHQADDARTLVRRTVRETGYSSLEEALRNRLTRGASGPVIVHLSAVGVSDNQGTFFLRPEAGSLAAFAPAVSRQGLLSLERVIDLFAESPASRKLLILDAGQIGSDRNLGVYGNGFVAALAEYLEAKKPKGLAVLCACAPGQSSWTSEMDQRSVFGYYVAEALTGKAEGWDPSSRGLTVHALRNYVRHNVAGWVAANRQAVQTPELYGDPALNFVLARSTLPRPAPYDTETAQRLAVQLDQGWSHRDALERRKPFRHTPLLWQQYLETLLRAERLLRVGDYAEAEETLIGVAALEKKIADAANGLPWETFWSLAALERSLADQPSEARASMLKAGNETLLAAFNELTGGTEEATATPTDKVQEVTAEDASKTDEPEPKGAAKKKTATRRPAAAPTKPRARGASAVNEVMARDDNRPRYVEGQLLVWVNTFVKKSGVPYALNGARGDLLFEALQARRLAEEAAASDERISRWIAPLVEDGDQLRRRAQDGLFTSDERISRWIAPLVEDGDQLRRRAQDGLFTGDSARFEGLSGLLEQARTRYREALDVADRSVKALDLVQQVEAELPYYGEWKARRGLRRDDGLDKEFLDLLDATAALAKLVHADVTEGREDTDPLGTVRDQVKKVEDQYLVVRAGFDRLQSEFQTQCASLAASGSGRWREINALLNVPLIPAETRRTLLQRIRSVAMAGALAGSETSSPPTRDGLARLTGNLTEQAEKRAEIAESLADTSASTAPDPDFWKQALGLARLEWGLFAIGGAAEADLSRLEDAYQAAQGAAKGEQTAALAAFARLSEVICALRADRLKGLAPTSRTTFAPLAAADRAVRVLPLADLLGMSDRVTAALDQYHRQALLLWHGRRLSRDFAPSHAQRLFAQARQVMETDALRAAILEGETIARARITLDPEPDETLILRGWKEEALSLGVAAVGNVPAGDATLLVNYDASQPLTIVEKLAQHNAREGLLVPVRPEKAAGRVEYRVARTESSHEAIQAHLSPSVFYRGRFFQDDRGTGLELVLEPAKDPVSLTIQQSYKNLKFKDFTDQFKEHPGQGYLHFGTNLQYKLVLTSDRPLKVVVRYGLKEKPESFQTATLDIAPKKPGEIEGKILGNDFPIVKSADGQLNIAPLNLAVTVWKDKENGPLQGQARYPMRMIPPQQYIATTAVYDPEERIVALYVTHLANDPVTGPIEVSAGIGGLQFPGVIRRSEIGPAFFRIPLGLKKIRWRVGVESMPAAFTDEIDTPPPVVEQPPAPPAQ